MLSLTDDNLKLKPENYVKCFYGLFKSVAETSRSMNDWKKSKKLRTAKKKDNKKVDQCSESNNGKPPEIELLTNPSAFAVFSSVRSSILDTNSHINVNGFPSSNYSTLQPPELSDTIDTDSEDEDKISSSYTLPKIVSIGLRSVFTLIRESRTINPQLCIKALNALLDVLQGQLPESLKFEPDDVIDPLFELLLDLATTTHAPELTVVDGNELTSVACACVLSLVVVRGNTGGILTTIAALLKCSKTLAIQNIQMPLVLTSLQKSVEAVLLGNRFIRPDWLTYGIPKKSRIHTFKLCLPTDFTNIVLNGRSFVSNGRYLYLHTNRGLLKIGSGYGGTVNGKLYAHKADFYPNDIGWLGYANNSLYFKCSPRKQFELFELDAETLAVKGVAVLEGRDWCSSVMFSDGNNLGMITAGKDEGFVVRTINTLSNPVTVTSELPLKLARKCVDVFGWALFDEDQLLHTINLNCDDEVALVTAGKEFCILKTISGKLFYTGKGSCLGMKSNTRSNRWLDFSIPKSSKVVHLAAGHDGQHAVLVLEDGNVLFTGISKRGEDGDCSKIRRTLKPVKPKKMLKIEDEFIIDAACNNGSTALVTKKGTLLMFGKDTLYTDPASGVVSELKDIVVRKVALGKAHAAVLTNKGHLWTFGINNKGQCGRDFAVSRNISREIAVVAMETGTGEEELILMEDEEGGDQNDDWKESRGMCSPGQHRWRHRACMVCTICRECTGFGISCLSSILPNQNPKRPGQECGCGVGDSGCAECGCCKICARENWDNSEDTPVYGPSGVSDIGSNLKDYLKRRLDERNQKQRTKAGPSTMKWCMKMKGSNVRRQAVSAEITEKEVSAKPLPSAFFAEDAIGGSDPERSDSTRVVSIPPARVPIPNDCPVIQVSCGLHHTVVLLRNGEVYSFGSNIYGQLGVGNLTSHAGPVKVKIPTAAVQVAAGSNHTVILMSNGEVYTFGAYQKGQLGMNWWNGQCESNTLMGRRSDRLQPWYSFPNIVPNIGPHWGRRATWIGAAGDQTYIKIDEINSITLTKSTVMANKSCIIMIPHQSEHSNTFKCLTINQRDGNCKSFSGFEQIDLRDVVVCHDALYNIIWTFNPLTNEISLHNIIATESRSIPKLNVTIFSPGLALPVTQTLITRTQAAMHLLGCLDTLTQAQEEKLTIFEENESNQFNQDKAYSREDFLTVSRFENHGGGWGYSGHSVEAIRFMADTDILLGGLGLFGGRGEYTAKIKLFDIGVDGGDQENDGDLISETEEVLYECEPRQKYSILFDEPIQLQASRWYVAWARISGPSSDCGSGGQAMVVSEDQVLFYFKSSKKSNNGTDVNAGQIPQLLYRVITRENQPINRSRDQIEPVYGLKNEFCRQVTDECFQSLIALLQWSWNTLQSTLSEKVPTYHTVLDMDHYVYISGASLRILKIYINDVYPNFPSKRTPAESVRLAECIGDVRALLKQILSYSLPSYSKKEEKFQYDTNEKTGKSASKMIEWILDECHKVFVACYHAFYPTAYLKWTSLCELLSEIDKDEGTSSKARLLSAILASLCNSTVRLRCTFPILSNTMDSSDGIKRRLSPSDNSGFPMMNSSETHQYPILVEQMSFKSQKESTGCDLLNWSFQEVLDCLLDLILVPVKKTLFQESCLALPSLTLHCCHLLARVISEMASQSSGLQDELQSDYGRPLYSTPSRFTRTNQTRTWNTGNGSPDAICFSVDKVGIVVAGVGVYGGVGVYNYELELLDDQNNTGNDPTHTQRWSSIEFARGSFGPDDCINDIVELKFSKAIPIKENVKYAIRLRNYGGRTSNGDGGLTMVRGPDGTNFTFSVCSLSFNGTTQTRGQISHILYYSNPKEIETPQTNQAMIEMQARKCTLAMTTTIVHRSNEILALAREKVEELGTTTVIESSSFITTLLPLVIAHIYPLATLDSRSGVQILSLIQEMLPHVAGLNLMESMEGLQLSQISEGLGSCLAPVTTSQHCAWVESDHPYKPATVSYYKVTFSEIVKWMTLEFVPECGTCQPEDYLQVYIPNSDASENNDHVNIPVLHKMSNLSSQWPKNAVILPGNTVIFSLETASDYMKDDSAVNYGFKCLVNGYECMSNENGLKKLETELTFLGGACAASLIKKNLVLPAISTDELEDNLKIAQDTARRIFSSYPSLLGRGFALASPPTITQTLDGILPFSCHSNERLFLKDFVFCSPGTSGERLARWLQPDSFVDPTKCEVSLAKDDIRCGWPATVTISTRDQYGEIVIVPGLKIVVKAIPIDSKDIVDSNQGKKNRRISQPDPMTFGGHSQPSMEKHYEVTVNNKMCFYAITIMKAYQNYSFEELRFASPAVRRSCETMLVRQNQDGTYNATWTPSSVGWYSLMITIDGYAMDNVYKMEVKEPPKGIHPPAQSIVTKPQHQPSRLRKFVAKNSAGLRVRTHPSLQSEQIGIIPVQGTVIFAEEIRNDDGIWLRLTAETIKDYCNIFYQEAWCLGYNQHIGKTLLLSIEGPKLTVNQVAEEEKFRKESDNVSFRICPPSYKRKTVSRVDDYLTESGETMVVITSGASGHNIRSRPSLEAAPVGMLTLGDKVTIQEYWVNEDGTWVRMNDESVKKYCFSENEAWSLAINKHGVTYMEVKKNSKFDCEDKEDSAIDDSKKKIDFSGSSGDNDRFNFTAEKFVTETANSEVANPFIFGSLSHQGSHDSVKFIPKKYEISSKISKLHCKEKEHEVGGKFNILHKWLRGDDKEKSNSASRDFSEFVGVSVKELVKAIGESRINGNGATPPETPQKLSRSSSPKNGPGGSPKFDSHSSSPILIPLSEGIVDSTTSQRFGSTQSDTSAVASSLTRDPSQSPSGISSAAYVRDLSPSPSCSSFQMKSGGSIASLPATPIKYSTDTEDVQKMSQAQTQTSPDISSKSHFSIRSPNQARRDQKPASARSKRSISPVNAPSNPSFSRSLCTKDKPKTAISPSVAECLRAVFAAFLWHEGIVHDAMACASFLKFHPTLPKHGTPVITRQPPQHRRESKIELTKEEKSRQRHSVEVSNAGNYLHIQPSTLETLTRSAVNANANRNRKKQEINLKDEINSKLTSLPECQTVAILPPALKCLVFLWEEIHTLCLQAIEHNLILASPNSQILKVSKKNLDKSRDKDKKANRKKKEWGKGTSKPTVEERTGDPETTCELCGLIFSHPVTYHMKTMHPGCGWQSGGMGYNNVGSYCSGWAGNCGDSDFGGTCWYLICDSCRDKYLKTRKNKFGKKLIGIISRKKGKNVISPILSPGNTESHLIMKNNAMFLLELSSSASGDIPKQQRRTSATLSSVAENSSPPDASPFPPTGTFQYLTTMGISGIAHSANQFIDEELKYENYQTFTDDNQNTSSTPSDCPTSDNNLEGLKFRGIFHRSISMSTGAPWAGNDGSIVTTRKRNNSSVERNNENGSSLLCFTSPQLQKLVPSMDQSAIISTEKDISNNDRLDILTRPVLSFVLQQHNLQQLQLAMKHALRLAACRVYAMQAFNWLLKSVTQSVCLHDLLWWFVASLTSTPDLQEYDENVKSNKKDESDITGICEHPLSDLVIAGEALHPLTSVFHNLLQTIADLMLLPPPGSPLQQAAIRCWGIKFTPADHMFLHRSHVFSNISKILSRSEEEEDMTISTHEAHQLNNLHMPGPVMTLKDFTSNLNIKASSRQAMIGHLTDNSTETFWESGDEDRNKAKTITITCPADNIPKMIYIHIDNCRDLAHKVFSVSFYSGVNIDEMVKLRTIEIESRSASWVSSSVLDPTHNVLLLELKGPDNSLRIRQIRILGIIEGESMKIQNQLSFVTIQQRNCEAETLKVFRLITSQVFGKLIQGDQQKKHQEKLNLDIEQSNDLEDSHDLREHMVGILFSQRKLTHLQKQVCTHIVQSIRSETIRLHDEWENLLCSPTSVNGISLDSSEPLKPSDTYCFEMLSMVLALSGSSVGRNYLSHQVGLLKDLLSLLHTGSARIQRQVASLLRRILPAISPDSLANVLDVPKLPPTDFSTVSAVNSNYSSTHNFDMYVAGILDVFLSCIAKSLSLQVKIKGKENGKNIQTISLATSIHPKNFYGTRWWLRGTMTRKLAEVIIQLLKDMASGELNEAWASVTKAAIAENILNLTRLDEKSREPTECLKTPTVWLALSSLCVLDSDHVERLSSGQWNTIDGQTVPPRPICSNHDDGETTAMIQCNTCGNLCAECDRIMHLHRRTRLHVRQVCKEEEKAIRVDLHEGCGRIKLFWVLALADSRTLKALVEFRDGTTNKNVGATSGICRFCGTTGNTGLLAISNICSDHECQEYAKNACNKTHPCGHICGGVRNEKNCLPCLQRCQTDVELKQDADDMCMICFTEALSCAPAIQLTCGHIFHFHCCKSVLMKRWVGPRITFGFSLCPICKMSMIHPGLSDLLEEIKVIFADVRRKALMRLEYEGLHKSEAVTTSGGRYYQDPTAYAMDRYAYYICYKCQKAYYGGEARCDAQLGGESFDPTELVCGACSDVARAQMCPKHGADFLEYKCRYCCSTAVFFCFGTTHFCNPCHDDFQRVTNIPKSDLPSCPAGPKGRKLESDDCPLHVKHPPTGEEFALGCGICRNAHTF